MTTYDLSTARWRKSSYSGGSNGSCVEVADNIPGVVPVRDSKVPGGPALVIPAASWSSFIAGGWRKSSYSGGSNGDCVEVADGVPGVVPVRDSKAPEGPALVIPAASWSSFIATL
ncbi:DUF397 domain-containing protein [Streptomyces sp. NBC_01803]|uniref:DUF397 domain-containing protein n=1 Tax=Streptomyces sp. NBC_01803 TaxID=2975946 RepID=UPI002DDA2F84|nr:DUF397 domain-containing protein [Streptomyces sp. NBC_01803]WSA44741.1 DUF397 domain-containing protein [Streptomyces sp. NBC_01803]